MGRAGRRASCHNLRACLAIHNCYVIARSGLLWVVRLCCVYHLEAQNADDLPVFGEHLHLPAPYGVTGEVLLVGPGAIAFLAPTMDVQGNAVDFLAVEFPHMVNPLI